MWWWWWWWWWGGGGYNFWGVQILQEPSLVIINIATGIIGKVAFVYTCITNNHLLKVWVSNRTNEYAPSGDDITLRELVNGSTIHNLSALKTCTFCMRKTESQYGRSYHSTDWSSNRTKVAGINSEKPSMEPSNKIT